MFISMKHRNCQLSKQMIGQCKESVDLELQLKLQNQQTHFDYNLGIGFRDLQLVLIGLQKSKKDQFVMRIDLTAKFEELGSLLKEQILKMKSSIIAELSNQN